MKTVLLDTNVVSFVFKGDSRAQDYEPFLKDHHLALSFISVAELFEWAATRKWGRTRITQLEEALSQFVVLPVDIELCRRWGELRASRQAIGRPIAAQDAWIAATALHYGLPLVTHNPRDFQGISGLEVQSAINM